MDIHFNFLRIKLDQFAAFDCTISQVPIFSTNGDIQVGSNYEEQIVSMAVSSNVTVEENLVLTIKVICFFKISTESWESLKTDDGTIVIPRDFLFHIGGLAMSTVRGILFAKTDGTDLNNYIMPIINMDQLIDADLEIRPDEK